MQRGTLSDLFELLSSMRFAISLLTVLGIASIIGTVIQQGQPYNAYLNQFGPFWFPVLEKTGLYNLYNTTWFVVILAFLVLSTSLCIVRQTAPMLREIRGYREHAREASLRQFAHQHGFQQCTGRRGRADCCQTRQCKSLGLLPRTRRHRADMHRWIARWRSAAARADGAQRQGQCSSRAVDRGNA
jgi:hypothetical protein